MFNLTLVDHLRLTFRHVVRAQYAHTEQAARLARHVVELRLAQLAVLLLLLATSVAAIQGYGRYAAGITISLGLVAVAVHGVALAFDLEGLARAHRTASARLWLVREQYRALLADLVDQTIDESAARKLRDRLMADAHAVYETAPPAERRAMAGARRTSTRSLGAGPSDEEIDELLPVALRTASSPTPQAPSARIAPIVPPAPSPTS